MSTLLSFSSFAQQQVADVVFVNAKVWTANTAKPDAQAIAVLGDRILAVGTDAEIRQRVGQQTKVVDVKGRRLLPGFIDNHTHFMSGGFQLQSVDLRYANDEAEFARIIQKRAEQHPGRWITGGDWDHDRWKIGNLPTKELIDRLTPNTPVFVNRYDGHMALANSYVLKLAGITRNSPDPPGGTIVKDPKTGEPTGVLKDEAMSAVYKVMPEPSEAEMLEAAMLALVEARKLGVTSIQDISASEHVRVYQLLKARGA
ncbi:MAG TPA: amidohydrolase family protein, partial [Bacteroidota bacterium]